MGLDALEFRTPITESRTVPLLLGGVWQRRLTSLWAYVLGLQKTATLNFPNTLAGASSPLTVAVPGAALGDFVAVGPVDAALVVANSFYVGVVSADGVVTVLFVNASAAPINPASGEFNIKVTSR